jgi:primosomal protein N' (replication factor Y)
VARLVSVAVPVPALDLLTYTVPDRHAMPPPGARVVVPLGPRTLTGVVVGEAEPPDGDFELRELRDVLDTEPYLPRDVIELADWVGDYYLAGPGATLSMAMPPHALTNRVDAFRTVRVVSLTAEGHDVASRIETLSAKQADVVLQLRGAPDGIPAPQLAARGISAAVVARLRTLGLVTVRKERQERDPFLSGHGATTTTDTAGRALTDEQETALARLRALADARAFRVALLHGITGSGKTEVYLHLADAVRHSGRGVLMMVPEIALTPAVAAAFRARFGAGVAIQHSGLSDGERHDQWHRIRRGEVDVVIGTRSAVFTPLARPGLIIVDEEHDTSYKQ